MNSLRVRAEALTLQQYTHRLNNHSRSQGSLELIMWVRMCVRICIGNLKGHTINSVLIV